MISSAIARSVRERQTGICTTQAKRRNDPPFEGATLHEKPHHKEHIEKKQPSGNVISLIRETLAIFAVARRTAATSHRVPIEKA